MDDLIRAYYSVYETSVEKEASLQEEVNVAEIKKRIDKDGKKAANPDYNRKDVDKLHNKRREDIKRMVKEEKRSGAKTTYLPKSREKDIGRHDDWKDPHPDTLDWGQKSIKAQKLSRRANAVIGTQRRQDKEIGLRKEDLDSIIEYLIDNGFADDEETAFNIMESMSENWLLQILDEEIY